MSHNHLLLLSRISLVLLSLFSVCHVKADEEEGRGAEFRTTGSDGELLKRSSHPNNEQQANKTRVELWFYWEKRLNRAYRRLQRHYKLRPEIAEPLKDSQQAWLTARDATMRAFGFCLRQRNEIGRGDG